MPLLQGLVGASRLIVAFTQSSLRFRFALIVTCYLAFPVLTIKAGETSSHSDADDVVGTNTDDAPTLTPAEREVEFHAIIETFINSYVVDAARNGDAPASAETIVVFPITDTIDPGAVFNDPSDGSHERVDRSTLDDFRSNNSRPHMMKAGRLNVSAIVPQATAMRRIMRTDDVKSWNAGRLKHDTFAAAYPDAQQLLLLHSPGIGRQGTQAIIMAALCTTQPVFVGKWTGGFLLEKEQGEWKMRRVLSMYVQ